MTFYKGKLSTADSDHNMRGENSCLAFQQDRISIESLSKIKEKAVVASFDASHNKNVISFLVF